MRQRDRHHRGPQGLEAGQRRPHRVTHGRGQALAQELVGHANAQALERHVGAAAPVGGGYGGQVIGRGTQAGGVALVEAGHGRQQQRAVGGRAGKHAGLIQTAGEGDHAVARDAPVGGLDAGDTAHGSRLTHRTAGVGPGGDRHQAGRHGSSRAARRATGHAGRIPGVLHRAEERVLVARPHGEFVAVELADADGTGLAHFAHDGGVKGALVVRQHLRAGGGLPATGDKDILVGHGHTQQRACALAGLAGSSQPGIGLVGLRQRQLGLHVHEGVDVTGSSGRQAVFGQFTGRDVTGLQGSADGAEIAGFQQGLGCTHAYSTTRGTRYRPSATDGAERWFSVR